MIMALNLHAIMKRLVVGKAWMAKRMKEVRFALINPPGRRECGSASCCAGEDSGAGMASGGIRH